MDNNYASVYIYVPEKEEIVRITEGAGDNLLYEDIEQGFVDYIYYEQHVLQSGMPETDGGMILLTEPFQEKFNSTKEAIPSVLDMAYGTKEIPYIVLK